MAQNKAAVKSVLSGDTVILRKVRQTGPPAERLLALSNVQAPRLGNREKEDEPFAFAARDYIRKLLVGKEVSFKPEYTISNREYGSIFINNENVAQLCVKEGWLKVRETRRDASEETVAEVEALKKIEAEAVAAKKGVWTENKEEVGAGVFGREARLRMRLGIRTVNYTWSGDAREFLNTHKGKPIDAIVEQIRDGSTLRVLLMLSNRTHQYITLFLTGVKAPMVRRDISNQENVIEPFGEEARSFVESRLLQRQVQIILEGVDRENFIGSVRHAAGNIAESLVSAGLAKVAGHTVTLLTEGPGKIRAAESAAKEKRLHIWQDYVAKEKTEDQEFSGLVTKIISGDTVQVRNTKTGVEKKLQLSSIKQAPKTVDVNKDNQRKSETGYQWEAREFLRKKLIGKNVCIRLSVGPSFGFLTMVHVTIDYTKPPSEGYESRECATVKIGEVNIAEALVERGLATVIKHRRDDENRSLAYDQLLIAETKATEEGKGVHSSKEPPTIRIVDASESAVKARQFLAFFKRGGRVNGVIDYVANGSRFFVWVPKENCRLALVLSGIRAPRVGRTGEKSDPFGQEALDFVTHKTLQRDVGVSVVLWLRILKVVELEIENVEKNGSFIGSLFVHNENIAVSLLEAGYATVHDFSAEQSTFTNQLYAAERVAKAAQKGVWAGYEEVIDVADDDAQADGAGEVKRDYVDVVVTEIIDGGRFYVQIVNENVHKLEKMMAEFSIHHSGAQQSPADFKPKTNEIVSARFTEDKQWYRAKIRKQLPDIKSVEVIYVDYGNSEVIPLTQIRPITSTFNQLPHQAQEATLSFLKVPAREVRNLPNQFRCYYILTSRSRYYIGLYSTTCLLPTQQDDYGQEAYERLQELIGGKQLVANVDYRDKGVLSLTLYDPAQSQTPEASINADMVRDGLATVNAKVRYAKGNQNTLKKLQEALAAAKEDRLNLFEYGDITADDD
ncbi:tudor domain-containing protein [Jimgerdemannia flammicorona]|uniref:Tudor domain-containing protein n=1 Tax=Jimgerdemannia flammicorona TaxID=994334 RepID=A0A433DKF3_9FUNG|nr:tudor domain-containing protein [Jimgerdemannia flammicorona]